MKEQERKKQETEEKHKKEMKRNHFREENVINQGTTREREQKEPWNTI